MNEAKDSLQSRALLSILDLLGEGEIAGLVNGDRSIFFNETPLRNADGTYNFKGVATAGTYGTNNQSPLTGFGNSIETPYNIGIKLNSLTPYTFSVTNSAADLARVIINIPGLSKTNSETGDINGTTVEYKFQLSTNGGAFQDIEVDASYVDNVTWSQVGGYWQVTAPAGSSKLTASITATSAGNGVGQIVFQPQEFNGTSWQNLGETKTVDVIGAWENSYSEAPTFKTRASLSMPVESLYSTIRFVPVSIRLDSGTSISPAQGNASYWKRSATVTVNGKTRSKYQRSHILRLPTPRSSAQIRVTRLTADATDSLTVNETWIESFTEITSLNVNYPNSALVGIRIDAQQFNSIPSRAYLVDGLKIQVPSNYNPVTRVYTGVWNGTFQTAYSNNPAWVLYDVLTNNRYGLGNYLTASQVDKAALYTIGKYCDELVPDGQGGTEPRFTINTVIQNAADAYKVIMDITSAFRGMAFWDGGVVGLMQDSPADPSMLYTNANVVEGMFSYTGSARKDRHSVVHVAWNDPSDNYKRKVEYVEDPELIQRFGVRRTDTLAFGCTSRGQAARIGKWILYTERFESDVIQFKVGLDAAFLSPGEIIKIHDRDKSGKRFGGRLVSCTTTGAILDSAIELTAGTAVISLMMPDGTFVERTLDQTNGTFLNVTWAQALTQLPVADAVWMASQSTLSPVLARVIGIVQGEDNTFEISAVEHNASKFAAIEQGLTLQTQTTSIIDARFVDTPESLVTVERQLLNDLGRPEVRLSISWYSNAGRHEVAYRNISADKGSNWTQVTVENQNYFEVVNPALGEYEIAITAINPLGKRSKTARINYNVQGKTTNNDLPTDLTIRPVFNGIALTWTNATNKDFAGVEIWRNTTNALLSAVRIDATTSSTYTDMTVDSEVGEVFYWIRAFDTYGNYTGYVGPASDTALEIPNITVDTSQPPGPTGLTATAGLATITLEWASPAYTNHSVTEIWTSASDSIAGASLIATSDTTMFAHALGTTGVTRYYWIRFRSKADIVGPYNAVAGVSATTGKIGNTDLGPLIVEAGNLANNAVNVDKILAGAVDVTKFASSIEPVTIVTGSTVPTTKSTNTIFLTGTGKLYRWNGTAYVASVATADLSGTISDAQIAGLAASKVTGQLTDSQIADIAAAKLTGQVVSAQIADAAVSTAKFASGIRPVEIVSSLPASGNTAGRVVFLTTDNKLYRYNGTAWVASVASSDISGTIADAQIAGLAASKVTGQLTNSQIADVAAAKLTGQVVASQIADAAVTTAKFASGIEPLTVVSGTLPTTKSTNTIFRTDDQKVYRWNGSAYVATVPTSDLSGTVSDAQIAGLAAAKVTGQLTNSQIADVAAAKLTGQVTSSQIADAAVTTAKFASGIEPISVVVGTTLPTVKSTNSIYLTGTGKLYRWVGSAYSAVVDTSDLNGTVSDAQIAGLAASKVTGQLTNSQIADVAAAKLTGQVVASQIADATITTAKFASSIEPLTIVSAVPGTKSTSTIFNTTDGKLYRWNGSAYIASVSSSDISGTLAAAQIASLAASQITGQLTDTQIAAVGAAKVTGQLVSAQIADAAITAAKFANGIEPVEIVSTLPTTGNFAGRVAFLTTDNKLYRHTGSAWVSSVASSDISGTISDAQITGLAASKVTGQLSDTQLAGISAAKISGQLSNSQIADLAATKISGQLSDAQVAAISAAKVTGTLTASQLNVSIGGGNLVPNASFEIDTNADGLADNWALYAAANTPSISTDYQHGAKSQRFLADGGSTPRAYLVSNRPKLVSGQQYTLTAWVKTTAQVFVGYKTFSAASGGGETNQGGAVAVAGTGAYQRVRLSFTAPNSDWISPMIGATNTPAAGTEVIVDSVQLELGDLATAFAPKPDEILPGTITATEISDNAITTPKLIAGAITTAKIAAGAVTASEIAAGAITTAKLSAGAVTANEIAASAVTAGKIAANAVTATEISAGAITTAKIAAGAVTAGEIAAGAITTAKIAAGAITSNEIAANTITAADIAAGTITATELSAGSVTTAKLAAGAVTANEIAAGTITGGKIAAGTITGSNIAADTITAGQIAAGAITASEIASSAITTEKLLVTGRGTAINDDPFTSDATAWPSTGLWSATWAIATITDGPSGSKAIRSNSGAGSSYAGSRQISFNPNKSYRVRCKARSVGANGSFYLVVDLRDSAGTVIPLDGTAWFYPASGVTVPGTWTDYEGQFGVGTSKTFPANARTMSVGALMNYNGTAGYHEVQDIRIEERADASLIVDGAISASKISAGAVTTAKLAAGAVTANEIASDAVTAVKIQAGAITTAKLAAGAVTANEIAASTITGGKIAAGTITGSNIAADTITAGQIAAGAISASEIAAGAIVASKLVVENRDDVLPDSGFNDFSWWGFGADNNFLAVTGTGSGQPRRFCRVLGGMSVARDYLSPTVPVEAGAAYRIRLRIFISSDATGTFGPSIHLPDVQWYTPAPGIYGEGIIDLSTTSIPKNAWTTYTGTITFQANTQGNFLQARTKANILSGVVEFAWEVVRAASGDLVVDGAITAAKIEAGAVTTAKLAAGAVTANEIAANAITAAKIEAGAITTAKLAAGAVTANEIAASTITGGKIAAGTITGSNIAADTITAGQIAAGAIGASEIASKVITADKVVLTNSNNIITNPVMAGGSVVGYAGGGTPSAVAAASAPSGCPTEYAFRQDGLDLYSEWFDVLPGETYNIGLTAAASAGVTSANFGVGFRIWYSNGNTNDWQNATGMGEGSFPSGGTWTVKTGQFSVPATAIKLAVWIHAEGYRTGSNPQPWYWTNLRVTRAASAELIVDGAITAAKVSAGAITTAKLAAGAVTANEIASNAITAAKIEAGAITTAKLAAGAVTANEIAASTITGGKIAAGTITGSNIAADTITAGQIAAGAISASEVASNAITTAKLFVSGAGAVINDDPNTQDSSAWTGGTIAIVTDTTSPTGSALQITSAGATTLSGRSFPLDAAKNYNFRIRAKQVSGTSTAYLLVAFFDSSGAVLSGSSYPTGWPGVGSYHYFGRVNQTIPTSWTEYSISFGPDEVAKIPTGAVRAQVGFLGNYTGTGEQRFTAVRLMEKASADLIVDGAITAAKINAGAVTTAKLAAGAVTANEIASNAITSAKIDAGAITTAKLAAGAVTATEIAASTITGAKIAANTITGSNIAADTITAGQIAAGAISASEIAAGAVTAEKLTVSSFGDSVILNSGFEEASSADSTLPSHWTRNRVWGGTSGNAYRTTTGLVRSGTASLELFPGAGVAADMFADAVPVAEGEQWYLSCRAIASGTNAGTSPGFYFRVRGGATAEDISSELYIAVENNAVPATWTKYEGTVTIPAGMKWARPFVLHYSTNTGAKLNIDEVEFKKVTVSASIADGAISAAKISAGAVTTAKLAAGAVTADEIAANAITAAKISTGAITAAKIEAGAVDATKIAASTITGDKIAANTITGSNIAADTITAGQIAAGAISASEIASNAITTAKLLVTGQGKSINSDPTFADSSAWTSDAGAISFTGDATSPVAGRFLRATGATRFQALTVPIEGGKQYKISMWARKPSGTGLLYIRLYCYDNGWTLQNYVVTALSPATGTFEGLTTTYVTGSWSKFTGYIVAASTATRAAVLIHANWGGDGYSDIADLRCEEYIGADLIVDGAVTADKIAANAITAGKIAANAIAVGTAAIQNGAIVNAMIGTAAIDDAKIATATITSAKISSLAVDKLTAGNLAVGQYIYSQSYVAGSSGWAIKADGTAEFGAASIRGQLTASQINSNGLTIRDNSGNILFGVGNPLDFSNVGGATKPAANATKNTIGQGTLAARPTGSDGDFYYATDNFTLYQKISGSWVASSNQTYVDSSGQVQGVSSGAGTSIANDRVRAGGVNLVGNSGFLRNNGTTPTNWGNYNNASTSVTTSVQSGGMFGQNYYRITTNAATTSTMGVYVIQNSTDSVKSWEPGQTYCISFWARGSAGAIGKTMTGFYSNMGFTNQSTFENPALTSSWQRYSYRGTPNSNASTSAGELFISWEQVGTLASGSVIDICCPKVELGTQPSAWTPSPQDTLNQNISISSGAIQGIGTGAGTTVDNTAIGVNASGQITGIGTGVNTTVANSQITIASGAIQGIGTGAGTTVANNQITIDGAGALNGIGTGSGKSVANNVDSIIRAPGGGLYVTSASSVSGAIKIRLPQFFTDTMMRFRVEIYEYSTGYMCTLEIGGYNYSSGSSWINVSAKVTGGSNVEYPVYFGHDGTKCCIWIGAYNETWNYPQVRVADFFAGYNNFAVDTWATGWTVGFDTTNITSGTGTNQYSASVLDTYPAADWSKTARRPSNLSALAGTENIQNSQITISSGAIQGIGTGAGTAVANSQITLSDTGALTNAGGGQVKTLTASDTRSTNAAPSAYNVGITEEFKQRSAIGAPGAATYGILKTEKPWSDASGGVVTQTFKSENGEYKRTSTPGDYATWASWSPITDKQVTSTNISTFVANDAIGISQIGTTLQTTNYSSTAGWQINKSGTATFNDVALRGAVNSGAYTGYAWPAAGTQGFHLGPNGLLLGNYNNGKYFQVEASGNVYAPGFSIVNGTATFSGTVSANVINTNSIVGGATSEAASATSTGATASVTITAPSGASAIFVSYYLGPPTFTSGGKNGVDVYGPGISSFTYDGVATGSIIIAPTAGSHTISLTRTNYTGTMRLNVLLLKR